MIGKWVAGVVVILILLVWLGAYVLIIPLVFLILWVIRMLADLFWWGRNNDRW